MAAGELTEQVADQLEEVAEVTRRVTGRDMRFLLIGGSIGMACGTVAGYFFADRRLQKKYSKRYDELAVEIDELRELYHKKIRAATPKPDAEELGKLVEEHLGYDPVEARKREVEAIEQANRDPADIVVVESETVNVFAKPESGSSWDYSAEVQKRSKNHPYIIHIDEFNQNEPEHEQTTYTYFEIDDILADPRDTVVDNKVLVIGTDNLRFGHGSNDPNVVYIRNDKLSLDLEILRNHGSYSEEVSGVVKHSDERIPRHRRRFDDEQT
jgi:hypothetical protein